MRTITRLEGYIDLMNVFESNRTLEDKTPSLDRQESWVVVNLDDLDKEIYLMTKDDVELGFTMDSRKFIESMFLNGKGDIIVKVAGTE